MPHIVQGAFNALSLHTPAALQARGLLRWHPKVCEALRVWWDCAERSSSDIVDDEDGIGEEDYVKISKLMYGALVEPYDDVEAETSARDDWKSDAKGQERLPAAQYKSAIFEVADLHTDSLDPDDYATFLWDLLNRVTFKSGGVRHFWQEASEVNSFSHSPSRKSDSPSPCASPLRGTRRFTSGMAGTLPAQAPICRPEQMTVVAPAETKMIVDAPPHIACSNKNGLLATEQAAPKEERASSEARPDFVRSIPLASLVWGATASATADELLRRKLRPHDQVRPDSMLGATVGHAEGFSSATGLLTGAPRQPHTRRATRDCHAVAMQVRISQRLCAQSAIRLESQRRPQTAPPLPVPTTSASAAAEAINAARVFARQQASRRPTTAGGIPRARPRTHSQIPSAWRQLSPWHGEGIGEGSTVRWIPKPGFVHGTTISLETGHERRSDVSGRTQPSLHRHRGHPFAIRRASPQSGMMLPAVRRQGAAAA